MARSKVISLEPGLPTLKKQLLDNLGFKIISGEIAPGTVLQLESLALENGVSMSVVRETAGVLASLGLVESRKKLGTVVQEEKSWNSSAPEVVTWRLQDPKQRPNQFRWLVELRSALEPLAASLAAVNRDDEAAKELERLAGELEGTSEAMDLDSFLKADVQFHKIILAESKNPLIMGLSQNLDVVLRARHHFGLMPEHPDIVAVHFHQMLAQAIIKQSPEYARKISNLIVDQATDEFLKKNNLHNSKGPENDTSS